MIVYALASRVALAGALTECGVGTGLPSGGFLGATCSLRGDASVPIGVSGGLGLLGAAGLFHTYVGRDDGLMWDVGVGGGVSSLMHPVPDEEYGTLPEVRTRPHVTATFGAQDSADPLFGVGLSLSYVLRDDRQWVWAPGGYITVYLAKGRIGPERPPEAPSAPAHLSTVAVTGRGTTAAEARRNALERAVASVVQDLVPDSAWETHAEEIDEVLRAVAVESNRFVTDMRTSSESFDPATREYTCVARPEVNATEIEKALRRAGVEVK